MRYAAVVFDLFGTLVPVLSQREYEDTLSEMAGLLGAPSDEFVRLWLGISRERNLGIFTAEGAVEHICQRMGIRTEPGQIAMAIDMRLDYVRRALVPVPGAVETLTRLRAEGYRIALVSDCSTEIPLLWEHTPFAQLMDVPIFSSVVGLKKPDPRIYLLACERLGVDPQECIYVGDGGSRELTGALEVGMRPVLIRNLGEDAADAMRTEAEEWQGETIAALGDVLSLIS
jgi:putative hydrolase of the HAD superfamily